MSFYDKDFLIFFLRSQNTLFTIPRYGINIEYTDTYNHSWHKIIKVLTHRTVNALYTLGRRWSLMVHKKWIKDVFKSFTANAINFYKGVKIKNSDNG
jgi:hypothetical protein